MNLLEILFIAFGLSMDAFAISIVKGLSISYHSIRKGLLVSIYFSFFQMIMPFLGYCFAFRFSHFILDIDHWIAFSLLFIVGLQFIRDGFDDITVGDSFQFFSMIVLAVATSIDALVVGVTFAFLNVIAFFSILLIGVITFFMSFIGFMIGNYYGNKLFLRTQIFGGILLIGIGFKILLEHLFFT